MFERLFEKYPDLKSCAPELQSAYDLLEACFLEGGKVLVCGNGGSAADSEHLVGELMKGYLRPRPVPAKVREKLTTAFPADGQYLADHLQGALPAISLVSQVGLMTAYANDVAPEMVFAQQVYGYGRAGDVLFAISTSGNSDNILRAAQVGRACDLKVIGLTGRTGGRLLPLCDVAICVPYEGASEVQERHLPVYHALCAALECAFFGA